jgi:hypothetical protein
LLGPFFCIIVEKWGLAPIILNVAPFILISQIN